MKKKVFSICLSVVVLVALIAVLLPGCTGGGGEQGTIEVKATLCGAPWQGAVSYTLTPGTGSAVNGTAVPSTHTVDAGTWTCEDVSGGPAGAFLLDITPSATQTVSAGGTITFTLNFELEQDAAIKWLTWTVDGEIWQDSEYVAVPCQRIDVHFQQWVDGCEGYDVTINETSKLWITQIGGPPGVQVYVVNDDCALNKTPEPQGLPPVKKFQVPSFNGGPIDEGQMRDIPFELETLLDVETQWQLVKCLNYTKSINWLGIAGFPFDPGMEHPCVLFELIPPGPGVYTFQLVAEADVALVGDTDVNDGNNKDTSFPLILTVVVM